ncbi:MAG: hypothetical protein H6698_03130 [Myxococcales bacterium]|nr:hypothetical protein [Myxococcales bacterium]
MRLSFLVLAAALAVVPRVAAAEDAPVDVASIAPTDGAITLYLDCHQVYANRTFLRVMDVIEASSSYQAAKPTLDAWGFEPRSDLRELVVVFDALTGAANWVAVAAGDIDPAPLEAQLGERLSAVTDELGRLFRDGDISYDVRDGLAIAGTGGLFSGARARAYTRGDAGAPSRPAGTLWLHVVPTDADRAGVPSLASLEELTISLALDDTPSLALDARLRTEADAAAAAVELNRALRTLATVPEATAFGFGTLLSSTAAVAEGDHVRLDAELDAASWAHFSQMLEDLVEEELR